MRKRTASSYDALPIEQDRLIEWLVMEVGGYKLDLNRIKNPTNQHERSRYRNAETGNLVVNFKNGTIQIQGKEIAQTVTKIDDSMHLFNEVTQH